MEGEFAITEWDIRRCKNREQFVLWLETVDDLITFENIDNLIELLIHMELPEYTMEALNFKYKYDL